eukprot:scaffold144407_cov34-Tisochrysis_lutea.AAC.2
MVRTDAALLFSGSPAEGAPPAHMEQSQAKRQRPPVEAEQVCATPVAPHGPWPRPHLTQEACWRPPLGIAICRPQPDSTGLTTPHLHWACLMAEAPPTVAMA